MSLEKPTEQRYLESSEYQRKVQKANEKLAFRPFAQRFATIETMVKIAQLLLPLLSITFAVSFVMSWFGFLNVYVAFAFALSLLVFIEVVKNSILNNAWQTHFANLGNAIPLGVVALLISAVSFVTSYRGAETLVSKLSDKTELIKHKTNNAKDSIRNVYNMQIQANKKAIDSIKTVARKQWHGLTSKEQNTQINQYLAANRELNKTMIKELAELKETQKATIKEAKIKTFYAANWSKILAAFIELTLFLSIWFKNYYDYKTVQEHQDLIKLKVNYFQPEIREPEPMDEQTQQNKSIAAQKEPDKIEPLPGHKKPQKNIGFIMKKNAVNNAPVNDKAEQVNNEFIICKNCGKKVKKMTWNHKFCSDDCRITYWEKKNGRKLKLKK